MSEEAKVETDTVEADPDALFKEFAAEESGNAPEPKTEEKGAEGQAAERTPEGQAPADTPKEDAAKPPASETPDIWKDVPEPARKAFEESEAARIKAENVAKAHGGRLAQAYQERDSLAEKVAEAGKAAGPKTAQDGDETDDDYRKRMTEEYPEFARLFTRLDAADAEINSLKGNLDTVTTSTRATQTEAALEQQGRVFAEAHPKWEDEKKDPVVQKSFMEWAEAQPPYVQDALRANAKTIVDGGTAADLISRFKRETADPAKEQREERRKEQLDGARDTNLNGPGATKTGAADDDVEGIWKELAAKEQRQEQRTRR